MLQGPIITGGILLAVALVVLVILPALAVWKKGKENNDTKKRLFYFIGGILFLGLSFLSGVWKSQTIPEETYLILLLTGLFLLYLTGLKSSKEIRHSKKDNPAGDFIILGGLLLFAAAGVAGYFVPPPFSRLAPFLFIAGLLALVISQNKTAQQIFVTDSSSINRFTHPLNGYTEEFNPLSAGVATLLFGPFYFAVKGVWTHFIASILLAFVTFGISWLFYPFFTPDILRKHYLRKGWKPVGTEECVMAGQFPSDVSARQQSGARSGTGMAGIDQG